MKKMMIIAMVALGAMVTQASLLVEENFNYATTNLIGNTPTIGGTWDSSGVSIGSMTSGNLTAPSGFAASSGNQFRLNGGNGSLTNTFASQNSGTVYMSYLLQVNSYKTSVNGAAVNIGGLSVGGAAEYAQLMITNGPSASATYYQLGLGGRSTVIGPALSTQYALGTTHLIVVAYEFGATAGSDVMSLWVDPTSFGGSAPTANATMTGFTEVASLNTIDFKPVNVLPNNTMIDSLRVGTTWADVTPIPEPATIGMLGLGAFVTLLLRRMRR